MKKVLGIFLISWPAVGLLAAGTIENGVGFFLTVVLGSALILGSVALGVSILHE